MNIRWDIRHDTMNIEICQRRICLILYPCCALYFFRQFDSHLLFVFCIVLVLSISLFVDVIPTAKWKFFYCFSFSLFLSWTNSIDVKIVWSFFFLFYSPSLYSSTIFIFYFPSLEKHFPLYLLCFYSSCHSLCIYILRCWCCIAVNRILRSTKRFKCKCIMFSFLLWTLKKKNEWEEREKKKL